MPRGRLVGAGSGRGWASTRPRRRGGDCPRSQATYGFGVAWASSRQRRKRVCRGSGSVAGLGRRVGWGSGSQRRKRRRRVLGCVAGTGTGAGAGADGADGAGVPARSRRQAEAAVEAAVVGVLSVRRAGPSGVQGRAGAGAGAGSAALAGSGCAGRVGSPSAKVGAVFHWAWRSWGLVVAGVCMCGVTSFRCCVLSTAINCRFPSADCRLRAADCGQWAFPVCPFHVCLFDRCVCLVRGTAAGRGDPFRAISLPPVVWSFAKAWTGVRDAIARGAYHASPGLRPARATGEWSRILPAGRVGQRLGLVCLHLLDSCTESISLCVHQLSTTPGTPASPTRLETSHVRPRSACTPTETRAGQPPARPRPIAHLSVAARLNPNRNRARHRHPPPAKWHLSVAARLNPSHPGPNARQRDPTSSRPKPPPGLKPDQTRQR